MLTDFSKEVEKIGLEAQNQINYVINSVILKECGNILKDYSEYIKELDESGVLNIGNFDIKKTEKFKIFNIKNTEDILMNSNYITTRHEVVGTRTVEKRGIISWFSRKFGWGGYETVNVYDDVEYINIKKVISENITEMQHDFDVEMKQREEYAKKQIDEIKAITSEKLNGINEEIERVEKEIYENIKSKEELIKKVEENKEKTEWLNNFVAKMDDLLKI